MNANINPIRETTLDTALREIDAVDAASLRLEEAVAVLTARVDEIGS